MNIKGNYKAIEDMMIDRALTLKQMADGAGIEPQTVYAWRTGKTKPSLDSVYKLARFFEVDPRVFLD